MLIIALIAQIPQTRTIVEPSAQVSNDYTLESISVNIEGENALSNTQQLINSDSGSDFLSLETVGENYKLVLVSGNNVSESNEVTIIEEADVTIAIFAGTNFVLYQKTGEDYGIYSYNIPAKAGKLVIKSSDPESFNNITLLDNENYFYVEPKTGNYGYGNLTTGEITEAGQKSLRISSTANVNQSALNYPTVSPNGAMIALSEVVETEGVEEVSLKVFSTVVRSLEDPIFASKLSAGKVDQFVWTSESNFLVSKNSAVIADIEQKSIEELGSPWMKTTSKISPDGNLVVFCTEQTLVGNCFIRDINTKTSTSLDVEVSEAFWLNSRDLGLIVGESLYSFNYENKVDPLRRITDRRGSFEVIESNGKVVVRLDSELMEVSSLERQAI